jgi:hypothetical protein
LFTVRPYKDKIIEIYLYVNEILTLAFYILLLSPGVHGLNLDKEQTAFYSIVVIFLALASSLVMNFALALRQLVEMIKKRKMAKVHADLNSTKEIQVIDTKANMILNHENDLNFLKINDN